MWRWGLSHVVCGMWQTGLHWNLESTLTQALTHKLIYHDHIDIVHLVFLHFHPTFSNALFMLICKAADGKLVSSPRVESFNSPKVATPKEISCTPTQKESPVIGLNARSNEKALDKTYVVPSIVARDGTKRRDGVNFGKDMITFSRTKRGMLLKPAHVRRSPNSKVEVVKQPETVESGNLSNVTSNLDGAINSKFQSKLASEDVCRKSFEEENSTIKGVPEKLERILSPQKPSNQESCKFVYYSAMCL